MISRITTSSPTAAPEASSPHKRPFLVRFVANYGLLIVALSLLASISFASSSAGGGGGDNGESTFGGIYDTLKGWVTGTFGKLLALSAFAVGMGIGVVKQSVMAIVIGIAFALVLAYGPALIEGVFSYAVI